MLTHRMKLIAALLYPFIQAYAYSYCSSLCLYYAQVIDTVTLTWSDIAEVSQRTTHREGEKMTVQTTETLCVTGAGGFLASWLVKILLERGYTVRGTVRNPDDEKNAHLRRLEGAEDRLVLVKADITEYESTNNTIKGCDGVFHTACPVVDNFTLIQEAAISGTINVLRACSENKVGRVVVTSSIGAVYIDPSRPQHAVVNEDCWSDIDYLQATQNGYCLGKTLAERAAWQYAKQSNLNMVVVNPSVVLGPLLQSTMNASTTHILKYLTGSAKTYANLCQAYVDVRDVAKALVLVYESPSASGRYLCADRVLHRGDLVDLLGDMFPQYPVPRKCSDEMKPRAQPYIVSSQKLKDLGFEFMPFERCLSETVTSLQEKGFLM